MIFVPVMIWICLALQAPKWCFVLIYIGFAFRILNFVYSVGKTCYKKGQEDG